MDYDKAINLAISNTLKEGLNDTFPRPFEVDLLKNTVFQKKIFDVIKKSLNGNSFESMGVNNISHVLFPKNTAFDFRRCALIQPMDLIKYNAIIISLADEIEKKRIPISKKNIFSYRFKPEKGYLFNRNYHITSFQKQVREVAKKKRVNFVVSCDIANFYDRLNLHRLENSLLSIGCDKNKVKTINELLLFWSNRDSYGLPVGSNGSRILAEASLIGIDNFLKDNNIEFIRFVDDFRLFAPDTTTAHYWLTLLIERLWREGLNISKSKTKIEATSKIKEDNVEKNKTSPEKRKDKNPFIIIAGYGGTVPTRFREISKREIEQLTKINLEELIKDISESDFINSDRLMELIKIIVIKKRFDLLEKTIKSLPKYPQMTPYLIDAIIKNIDIIPKEIIKAVKDIFSEKIISQKYIPEYLAISYIRLLGCVPFYNKEIILKYFRELQKNSGDYIGRVTLEALNVDLTREDVIELKSYYDKCDLWEKRQIIRLINKFLNDEEKRPWIKNLRYIEKDNLFINETISPSEKPRKKKKKK